MELTESILRDVRTVVGLSSDSQDFDTDLLMYINSATATLNQNGIGKIIAIDDRTTWGDFQDATQIEGNKYFHMVPLYIALSAKLIFDPPPPSAVQYHSDHIAQLLWRLRLAYEQPYVVPVFTEE